MSLNVLVLDGEDPFLLDEVWTIAHLHISKRSVPSDEDVSQWPNLTGIKFPRLNREEKDVRILIGNDVSKAHWVYNETRGRLKQPYADRNPLVGCLLGA